MLPRVAALFRRLCKHGDCERGQAFLVRRTKLAPRTVRKGKEFAGGFGVLSGVLENEN